MTEARAADSQFADLLDELLEQFLNGEEPDLEVIATRHPAAAHRIGEAVSLAGGLAGRKVVSKPSLRGYEIVRELGRGGMGTVYLARQTSLDRAIALKVLPHSFGLSAASRQRFLEEARALAHVKHEHIVDIHRIVDDGELLAFEMEFVDGPSLHTVLDTLRQHRQQTNTSASLNVVADVIGVPAAQLGARNLTQFFVRLFLKVARALAAVHAAGFVHRDVKPANLLLRSNGEPVIVDFGLVRLRSLEATHAGSFAGTPVYSSPEQLRGDTLVGPASDVYSLAVTMYECLTLTTPFTGRTTTDLLQRIEVGRFPPLRRLAPDAPRDLETIILHAMEIDAQQRYADAGAFADDLQRLLELQPIRARPIHPVRRFAKFLRRHQKPLWAAACGALLVSAALYPLMGRVEAAARLREAAQQHVHKARQHLISIDSISARSTLRATAEQVRPLRQALTEYERALELSPADAARPERDVVRLAMWLQQLTVSQADTVEHALAGEEFQRFTAALGPCTTHAARALAGGSRSSETSIEDLASTDDQDRTTLGLLALLSGDLGLCNQAWTSLPPGIEQPLVDAGFGRLLLADGMPEAAYVRLLQAQRHFPGSARLTLDIADTALRLGDLAQARHWFEQLPDDTEILMPKRRLELDLRAACETDVDLRAEYEALAQADPLDSIAPHRLAQLAMRRGDLGEAATRLDKLLSQWPETTQFRLDRARVALQRRDLPGYALQVMAVVSRDFGRNRSLGTIADLLEIVRMGGLESLYQEGLLATGRHRSGRNFLGGEMPIRAFGLPRLTNNFETLVRMLHRLGRQSEIFANSDTWLDPGSVQVLFTMPLALCQLPLSGGIDVRSRLAIACVPWLGPRAYSLLLPMLRRAYWNLGIGDWNPIKLDRVRRPAGWKTSVAFGNLLLRVDDQTGDGTDEVLLGCSSPRLDDGVGSIVLVDGRSLETLITITGDSEQHLFAHSLAVIADIDGDGRQDWIVGCPSGTPAERRGRAELWSGGTHRRLARIDGDEPGFGVSVAGLGDCDGDGCPDFAVASAPLLRNNAAQGSVQVFSGRTRQVLFTARNDVPGIWYGACIANAGDADGDGIADLIVGGNFGRAPGLVRLYSGRSGAVLQTWSDPSASSGFGTFVRGLNDIDGDGHADVIVSAVRADSQSGLDQVFVYSGSTGDELATLTGNQAGCGFGTCVVPYLERGRRTMLAIGAPFSGHPISGAVHLLQIAGSNSASLYGPNTMGLFGWAIALTADRDGDDLPELFVAEQHDNSEDFVMRADSSRFLHGQRFR